MRFRPLFLILSLSLLIISAYSIIRWGFKQSIDFAGGSVLELEFTAPAQRIFFDKAFIDNNIAIKNVSFANTIATIKFDNINQEQKQKLVTDIKAVTPDFKELRFETLGPSLGRELLTKTLYAVILSSLALFIFIGSRFKDPVFGLSAVLAMFHDTFILIGSFSLLGHLVGAELDALFVTALLTTLSASVHDTVVTFNRIHELKMKNFGMDWVDLANRAVSETIVRSVNNSMTIIIMLSSLVVLGSPVTRWFAVALLIGVVCGTYSSIGVAIPLVLLAKRKKSKQ
jgi:preprotein translocase subunit SecF